MSGQEEHTPRRFWRVLGPLALILTGAGWLAIGLVWGRQGHVRSQVIHRGGPIVRDIRHPGLASTRKPYIRMSDRVARQSDDWTLNPASGSEYRAISARTWPEAQAMAADLGGWPVTIGSAAEQAWLLSTFGGDEPVWIGLTDVGHEGQWQWANGEPVLYTNWADREPNNAAEHGEQFAVMNWLQERGKWNDMSSLSAAAFNVRRAIVERPWRPRVLFP
ncbi:hypothetical protein HN371_04540 [Candidatus Poribacteria bacterium]|jgi:hypothetical protein|nr:hypothetical protein [Candidatus Poribacteria bacterium]MBT5537077.1 hypothetical protein [Candidatus Poribacteria bacterium]MBT7096194.1 hypothetical protein [Candidatus Poribacteria bacterium]MBT7805346.1 hypothetical protein [Candidatus Poribacteria bacterium]